MGTLPRLTPEQHDDPNFAVLPRYWIAKNQVDERLGRRNWDRGWLLGWRDITNAGNERTLICAAMPRVAVGHTSPLIMSASPVIDCLYANLASFIIDYVARQKMAGTHLTYGYITQLPVLSPTFYEDSPAWCNAGPLAFWIRNRVNELSYTSYDIASFAAYLNDDGMPFRWDEERRFVMQAELDAAFFHLYEIKRDDVDYIMETFPTIKRRDEERCGSFRTKDLILQVYDAMTEAISAGTSYQTILDPPPGEGPRHG
jgi:hypothetical protein